MAEGSTINALGVTYATTYGMVLDQPRETLLDGLITRTDLDPDSTPWSVWHCTAGVVTRNAQPTICRTRLDNVGDGISISAQGLRKSPDFTICRVQMTHVHDDAIENDTMQAGAIVDCLIDGAMVFLSCRYGSTYTPPDGTGHKVHIQDTMVRLAGYTNCYKPTKYGANTHGPFFKWAGVGSLTDGIPPTVDLVDCTLATASTSPYGSMGPPPGTTATGLTLIWCGLPGTAWPSVDLDQWLAICPDLTMVYGMEAWDTRAAQWRTHHP